MPREKQQTPKEHVRVVARFRPLNKKESKVVTTPGEYSLLVDEHACIVGLQRTKVLQQSNIDQPTSNHSETHNFSFDKVFGPEVTQERFFSEVSRDAVGWILEGYNSTIFAYGQTGTGKTHTMFGPDKAKKADMGVIPRATHLLFDGIQAAESEEKLQEYTVRCSFLEIYKERIRDLLAPVVLDKGGHAVKPKSLKIRQSRDRGNYVQGLTERYVSTPDEILQLIKDGEESRSVGVTNVNERSSRSHAVFTITVVLQFEDGVKKSGKLHLVDLAGSENVRKTGATGGTLSEAQQINKSLSALGNVIYSLTDKARDHVPYRDSTLTFLLKDSLGGNTRTVLVATCSPHVVAFEETLSTLRFAKRAKRITNKPIANTEESVAELHAALAVAREDISERDAAIREMHILLNGLGVTQDKAGRFQVPDNLHGGASSGDAVSSAELAEAQAREVHIVTQYEKLNRKYQKLKKRYLQEVEYNNQIKTIFLKQRELAHNLSLKLKERDKQLQDRDGSATQRSNVSQLTLGDAGGDSDNEEFSPPPSPRRTDPTSSMANLAAGSSSVTSTPSKDNRLEHRRSDSMLSTDSGYTGAESAVEQSEQEDEERVPVTPPIQAAYSYLSRGGILQRWPANPGLLKSKPEARSFLFVQATKQLYFWDSQANMKMTSKSVNLKEITTIYVGKSSPAFQKNKAAQDVDDDLCFSVQDKHRCLDLEAPSKAERDQWLVALHVVAAHVFKNLIGGMGSKFKVVGTLPDVNKVFAPTTLEQRVEAARQRLGPSGMGPEHKSDDDTAADHNYEADFNPDAMFSEDVEDVVYEDIAQSDVEHSETKSIVDDKRKKEKKKKEREKDKPETKEFSVEALYAYQAQAPNQLSFSKGDRMMVKSKRKKGWWKAKLGDKIGYIPSNYVEVKDPLDSVEE